MNRIVTHIIGIFLLISLAGCNDSETMDQSDRVVEKRIPIQLNTAIPLAELPSSRAIQNDSQINSYAIWVFEEGKFAEAIYHDQIYLEDNTEYPMVDLKDNGNLYILLPEKYKKVTLAMVANVPDIKKQEPQKDTPLSSVSLNYSNYGDYMPMFGVNNTPFEVTLGANGGIIVLHRALAKVEIRAKEAKDHFILKEISVYQYSIKEDKSVDYKEIRSDKSEINNAENSGYIYLPATNTEAGTKTCVIFRGKYKDENFDRYCKLDFILSKKSGNKIDYVPINEIEGNHQYIFDVQYLTDDPVYQELSAALKNDALNYVIPGTNIDMFYITDNNIMDITTNNFMYLGVTADEVAAITTDESNEYYVANVSIVTNSPDGWRFESLPKGVYVSIPSYIPPEDNSLAQVVSVWVYLEKDEYQSNNSVTIYVYGNNIRKSITIKVP